MSATLAPPARSGKAKTKLAGLSPSQLRLFQDPEANELVKTIARKMAKGDPERQDDFEAAGLVGLYHAARTFDPSRSDSFLGHARAQIRYAILDRMDEDKPSGFKGKPWGEIPKTLSADVSTSHGSKCHDCPTIAESIIDHRGYEFDLDEEPTMSTASGATSNGYHPHPIPDGLSGRKAVKDPKPPELPRGVRYDPKSGKYLARIMVDGQRKELGYISTRPSWLARPTSVNSRRATRLDRRTVRRRSRSPLPLRSSSPRGSRVSPVASRRPEGMLPPHWGNAPLTTRKPAHPLPHPTPSPSSKPRWPSAS
jgi:Sigma-70 region 2